MAELQTQGQRKRQRPAGLSLSELATLVVLFHLIRFRQVKAFYLLHVKPHLSKEFPQAPSYQRCVALKGQCSGISIADSTPLRVCDNLRINRHRVFADMAARGKSSTGWFFGFKLHAIINHTGELLDIKITAGNVNDRKALENMAPDLRRSKSGRHADAEQHRPGVANERSVQGRGAHGMTEREQSQQEFLHAAKAALGLTWDELAEQSGIAPRALKNYRGMP